MMLYSNFSEAFKETEYSAYSVLVDIEGETAWIISALVHIVVGTVMEGRPRSVVKRVSQAPLDHRMKRSEHPYCFLSLGKPPIPPRTPHYCYELSYSVTLTI